MDSNNLMTSFARLSALILALLLTPHVAFAETQYVATTARNVDISTDDLASLLLPLTQAELVAEAAAWQDVLQLARSPKLASWKCRTGIPMLPPD